MNAVYFNSRVRLFLGDCIEVMRTLPATSIDAVVCDPPYGLGFMGKEWDNFDTKGARGERGNRAFQAWCEAWAREALRLLRPGGHLAAFGGPRTYHRLASGIEDAGFEIRDSLIWLFGSGFPKSLDVAKQIDKAEGHWRVPASGLASLNGSMNGPNYKRTDKGEPITDGARAWDGWGTALKPAFEPIVLARKPLIGTVAANVLAQGTGALNIDGCRIWTSEDTFRRRALVADTAAAFGAGYEMGGNGSLLGRWPANVVLGCACDGPKHDPECAVALLDAQTGDSVDGIAVKRNGVSGGQFGWGEAPVGTPNLGYGGRGGSSRFFYIAKASRSEREAGLELLPAARRSDGREKDIENPRLRTNERRNDHPTVKPLDLMRWLCRLVTPPGGTILDPFLGSGTTAMAALDEGFACIGIERDERYVAIAEARIRHRHAIAPTPLDPWRLL